MKRPHGDARGMDGGARTMSPRKVARDANAWAEELRRQREERERAESDRRAEDAPSPTNVRS